MVNVISTLEVRRSVLVIIVPVPEEGSLAKRGKELDLGVGLVWTVIGTVDAIHWDPVTGKC